MRALSCECGRAIFYDNTQCGHCGKLLAFDPLSGTMLTLTPTEEAYTTADGRQFALCANRQAHQICNGVVPLNADHDAQQQCFCCALNRTLPDLSHEHNLKRWRKLELAKRRMISGISDLGLAAVPGPTSGWPALHFDFLEDQRSNPEAVEQFVATGHANGLITINVIEADDVQRLTQRELSSERYRTLLGHFRHEVGHYYYFQLLSDLEEFKRIFGDPEQDYAAALDLYYENGPPDNWRDSYISAYASSHPLEDWAESFAHYLHMQDMLQSAAARSLIAADLETADLATRYAQWTELSITTNALNRSLGLEDAYPFVPTQHMFRKFDYIEQAIEQHRITAAQAWDPALPE